MAKFHQVTGTDSRGNEIKDAIEAPTEEEAQARVRQMGYFVTKVALKKENQVARSPRRRPLAGRFLKPCARVWEMVRAYAADEEPPKTLVERAKELGIASAADLPQEVVIERLRNSTCLVPDDSTAAPPKSEVASPRLIETIRSYIADEPANLVTPPAPGTTSRWARLKSYVADEDFED